MSCTVIMTTSLADLVPYTAQTRHLHCSHRNTCTLASTLHATHNYQQHTTNTVNHQTEALPPYPTAISTPEKLPSIKDQVQTNLVTPTPTATPPLPLAFVAPLSTPRRASSQLMMSQWKPTTTAIDYYLYYCKKLNSLKHLVRTTVAESHN